MLCEELLCDVCIPLTELYISAHRRLGNTTWRKRYQGTFGSIWTAMVKKEISYTKTGKKLSVKLLCDRYVYASHIDKTFFLLCSFEMPTWTDLRRDIREHIQDNGEKENIFR